MVATKLETCFERDFPSMALIRCSLVAGIAATTLLLGASPLVSAGEFNRVLSPGDSMPVWEALEGVDGQRHGSADIADAKCVVVAFTCNSCPYAVDVEDRLMQLDKAFADAKVQLIAINVNKVEADQLDAMKQRAKDKGFEFPYLYDPSQKIAKAFGATRTPEFFVFNEQRQLVYQGALDDSPSGSEIKTHYLKDALQATLQDQAVVLKETVPIGCNIRYERQRRGSRPVKD